jgi:hypothetical protein
VLSWPDQLRTERAMAELDLLVVFDYKLTATGEFANGQSLDRLCWFGCPVVAYPSTTANASTSMR